MPVVPYTTPASLSEADRSYLGDRISKGPAIAQLLEMGKLVNDPRQLAQKLDADSGDTGGDADYEATVIDD
jgi:hypothetical protein